MEDCKLSIIIPMYNAEKYIADCLDSILNSDLPKENYEVIVVNDGSMDNSPTIAQEYCVRYENFRYLTQENQGQSVARNYGIREAQGEYLWFVDSDDQVDSNCLSNVLNELEKNSCLDIIAFVLKQVTEQSDFVRNECLQANVRHNVIISGENAIIEGYNPSSVCALWIKKQLIIEYSIFFKVGITHQDVELSYRLFAYANKVLFTDYVPYIYILHPNSTSQSLNPTKKIKYLSDDIVIYNSFNELKQQTINNPKLSSIIGNRAQNVLFNLVLTLLKNKRKWKPLGINRAVIDNMKAADVYPLRGDFDSWKKKLVVFLLNIEKLLV